jgi:hypothetical protein
LLGDKIEYTTENGTCTICLAHDIPVAGLPFSKGRVCKECSKECLIRLTGWRLRGMFAQFELAAASGRQIKILKRKGEL